MGDPAGIGPELCIRLLDSVSQGDSNECIPLVFGNVDILSQVSERIGVPIVCPVVSSTEAVNKPKGGCVLTYEGVILMLQNM